MTELKLSTAETLEFWMADSTNPRAPKTGLSSFTVRAKKKGGAWATITPTIAEDENGWYMMTLTTTHTNTLGAMRFYITATGADPLPMSAKVVSNYTGELSAASVQAIWDALTSALTTVGSIGKRIVDNLDAAISSRMATFTYTAPDNPSITAIKAKTDNLPAAPASTGDVTTVGSAVTAVKAKTDLLNFTSGNVHADVKVIAPGQITIKKNTALADFQFPMTDSTLHLPMAGLTPTVQRSIDGGAFANCTNAAVEIGSGAYSIDLSASDLNGTTIMLKISASGADTKFATIITQP